MIHKVEHQYQGQMLVPLSAMHNNIDFLCSRDNNTQLECAGGVLCKVKYARTVHAMDEEFEILLQNIYGRKKPQELLNFLQKWYRRLGHTFNSFEFLYIELYDPQTAEISE